VIITKKCRFCNSDLNTVFVDLGESPLSNSFLDNNSIQQKELVFPLCVFVCDKCLLVQLPEFEKPENIFREYLYFSSYSDTWLNHAKLYSKQMIERFDLNRNNLVIEIASNDGYLLQFFKENNIPILGIEPALNVAKVATEKGLPTITEFFDTELAKKLQSEGKQADLLIGNNVLAHVPNINDFVAGLKIILKDYGIITMEFPHLLQLIKNNQFDTIYHEHFSYLSLFVTKAIFSHHKLKIFDIEQLPTHGGSLRVFATHNENENIIISKKVNEFINEEHQFGLSNIETYRNFSNKVESVREKLLSFLNTAKNEGQKVVCYGAAAKGNTLLNYCKVDSRLVDYIVDKNPHKQGKFLPGSHLPIKSPDEILKTKPSFVLILPWNIKDEIINQMNHIRKWGGKFVVPIPEVNIID